MVGGGLDREVERELHPVRARRRAGGGSPAACRARGGQRRARPPRSRWRRGCPARPARRRGCCSALPVHAADRVDGREVEHVEAHRPDPRELADHVGEGAAAPRVAGLAAREQRVPGGEARPGAVGLDRILALRLRKGRSSAARISAAVSSESGSVRRSGSGAARSAARATRRWPSSSSSAMFRPAACFFSSSSRKEAKTSRHASTQNRWRAHPLQREARAPAVVAERAHPHRAPLRLVGRAPEQRGGKPVVAVADQVGPDLDHLAHRALRREAAVVHGRVHRLDREARQGARRDGSGRDGRRGPDRRAPRREEDLRLAGRKHDLGIVAERRLPAPAVPDAVSAAPAAFDRRALQ